MIVAVSDIENGVQCAGGCNRDNADESAQEPPQQSVVVEKMTRTKKGRSQSI